MCADEGQQDIEEGQDRVDGIKRRTAVAPGGGEGGVIVADEWSAPLKLDRGAFRY